MLTPNEVTHIDILDINYEVIENKIDNSIKRFHGTYPWEYAIVDGELPLAARNAIAKKYYDAGWKHVYHHTSSENGEKYGLTSFIFSTTPIDEKYVQKYFKYPIEKTIQNLEPNVTYELPIANGKLVIDVCSDTLYPGLDIEFVSNDENNEMVTRPRILIEAPIDDETKVQSNLRALIWAEAYAEDYTNKIVFTDKQLYKNKRVKLSFSDYIGYTEFEVYESWVNEQTTTDASELYRLAAETPDEAGLIS